MKLLFSIKNWRIRTRITALLLLPVVVAALLGGLRIQSSIDKTREMDVVQKAGGVIDHATTLVTALEEERDVSARILVAGGDRNAQEITDRQRETDAQLDRFNAAVADMDLGDLPLIRATVESVVKQMSDISNLRKNAFNTPQVLPVSTVTDYNAIISTLLSITQRVPEVTRNSDLILNARVLGLLGEVKAAASNKRALVAAYVADPDHVFNDAPTGLGQFAETERGALLEFEAVAPEEVYAAYQQALQKISSDAEYPYVAVQNAVSPGGTNGQARAAGNVVQADEWWTLSTAKVKALTDFEKSLTGDLLDKADQLRGDSRDEALLNTVLVIVALLITIILGVIVARSLVRSLNTLRRGALEIAEQRLPETVRRLSESEPGDVDLTVEPIGVATRDEVGQVARAFDAVHTEAVRLAAEQALLRGNVNSMFVNLSRRSQSLIQRQLALISDLENREADPDQLANLFKLDHLATRMRRNGENLLVLAGEEPGRRWTRPVPLVDVLRAAASEVEQYERVELGALPTTDIAGRAVNDLVHLLAELLENSTTFSSPHTKVRVTGHILPDGRALIEIHDNGIGLTGDDLADANQRLARPPVVDVSISRRMGLFVVGRLSTRHGIRVQLRPGDGGGTTALVMLPIELIQGDRPGGGNWDKSSGRPAVGAGWEPDALTASQEMQALPAASASPQRPGPEAGRSEPPRPLPQRAAGQIPAQAQSGAYDAPSAFAEGPATHDTPFPGTPFGASPDTDNPFAPVEPRRPRPSDDARPAVGGDTAQFASPFGNVDQTGQQPAFDRPQFEQPLEQTGPQPAVQPDFAQPSAYARPEYEQSYRQPGFDPEPVEHGTDDRGADTARRGPAETGGTPIVEPQRASAWSGQEYDGLSPVAPPQQMPAYEAPQRRGEPREDAGATGPRTGDALPVVRPSGTPARRRQAPQPDGTRAQQDPRALHSDRGAPEDPLNTGGRSPRQIGQAPETDAPRQQPHQLPQGQLPPAQLGQQTGQLQQPGPYAQPGQPAQLGQQPQQPQQPPQAQQPQLRPRELPAHTEPIDALDAPALPMTVEDERSPIFDTLESDWFHRRTGRGGRMRAAQVRSTRPGADEVAETPAAPEAPVERRSPAAPNQPLPQRTSEQPLPRRSHAGQADPAEPAAPQGVPQQPRHGAHAAAPAEAPRQAPPAPQPGRPAAEQPQSGWYSAGDEGWRAAEAAREPASGGTTGAGLPRRVPRANLVPGGVGHASQSAAPIPGIRPSGSGAPYTPGTPGGTPSAPPPGAPGLSRNPDDVRGRLTNFRRGIQQGRTAGAGGMAPSPRDENNQEQA
ncbi:nitrate- and nitrite sensing domain-containing protein [Yinghuangia sp. ASG 101]|uniref:sensor histidine kinase n=1 Tax=Yinghuangia sp. ASG 101 TaxID=2896848 RepID=UPI001E496A01|nr:nitrate- and nitrite sensing domain-containing protein [Yinghuangia sp. ASG 101]UGQ14160.1 nitrate- and nitrite sensing domain-containing protein [Yinghuangia sp. ASG 101]